MYCILLFLTIMTHIDTNSMILHIPEMIQVILVYPLDPVELKSWIIQYSKE